MNQFCKVNDSLKKLGIRGYGTNGCSVRFTGCTPSCVFGGLYLDL